VRFLSDRNLVVILNSRVVDILQELPILIAYFLNINDRVVRKPSFHSSPPSVRRNHKVRTSSNRQVGGSKISPSFAALKKRVALSATPTSSKEPECHLTHR